MTREIKPSIILKIDEEYYKKILYISGMLGLTPSQFVSRMFYDSTFKNNIDATYSTFLRNQELLAVAKLTEKERDKFIYDYLTNLEKYTNRQ